MRGSIAALMMAIVCLLLPTQAGAWGFEGHEIIAAIARAYVAPSTRERIDAILAEDPDASTGPDMLSRATWADAWRGAGHRETAEWHFADIELDRPDLDAACFGHPAVSGPVSAGPAHDCVVDKVEQFASELGARSTTRAERILALKYLLHLVGDMHQPLHASDNHDRGGNCVRLSLNGARTVNLHSYWDTVVVAELGSDAVAVARDLRLRITEGQVASWRKGAESDWILEAFELSKRFAYELDAPAGCQPDAAPVPLPPGYEEQARRIVALQLERAGVRLAMLLDEALSGVAPGSSSEMPIGTDLGGPLGRAPSLQRSSLSIRCSHEADARDLHGDDRRRFRRGCMR